MKTLLDILVENHEMYCLSFRCVLVNKSFIFTIFRSKGFFYVCTFKCTPLFSLNAIFAKTHRDEPQYSKLASYYGFYSRHLLTLSRPRGEEGDSARFDFEPLKPF